MECADVMNAVSAFAVDAGNTVAETAFWLGGEAMDLMEKVQEFVTPFFSQAVDFVSTNSAAFTYGAIGGLTVVVLGLFAKFACPTSSYEAI